MAIYKPRTDFEVTLRLAVFLAAATVTLASVTAGAVVITAPVGSEIAIA